MGTGGDLAEGLELGETVDLGLRGVERLHTFDRNDLSRFLILGPQHLTIRPFAPLRQQAVLYLHLTLHWVN